MTEEDKDVLLDALRQALNTFAENNRYDAIIAVVAMMRRVHDEP